MRLVWVIIAALLCAAPIGTLAATNDDGVAVIIGNRDYKDIPDVDFAVNDADAFKRFVVDVLGYDTDNIIDLRNATKAQLEAAFGNDRTPEGRLWRYLDPEGRSDVVVFYSGHGVPGLKDQRGYLLPVDADPDAPEINGYPVDQLYRNLAKLKARSITVLLDACFSGETQKGMVIRATSGISVTPKLPASSKLTILTAAQGDQVASWDEPARHGLFTNHILDALYGAADKGRYGNGDGKVALGEVKSYLDRNMSRAARRAFGRIQEATVVGERGAVLVAYQAGKAPQRPKTSVAKKATASLTPPQLDPIEAEYEAVRNANVRATPDVNSAKVAMLKQGTKVYVPGRVKGGKWYAVEQEGKRLGFVFAPLLREAAKPSLLKPIVGASPSLKPGTVFKDCAECPEMVVVPAGSFIMGSNLGKK